MCLTQVGRVLAITGPDQAEADVAGRRVRVSLSPILLEGGSVSVGDWVQLHTGLAMTVVDAARAQAIRDATTPSGGT